MSIRLMEVKDLKEILTLEHQLFTSTWNEEDFIYEIETNPFSFNYVIEENNEIIGYAGLWVTYEQAQITTIGVKKEYQRKGYASLLMNHLLKLAKKQKCESMSLEVRVSNESAIKLYEKFGFKNVGIRKNYYQDNFEDAYLMVREMEGYESQSF